MTAQKTVNTGDRIHVTRLGNTPMIVGFRIRQGFIELWTAAVHEHELYPQHMQQR